VTAIHQDAYGFIWFGTRGGLNQYNGYEFTTLRGDQSLSKDFPNQAVEVIVESKHTLWIGNKSGGLNSYDLLTDSITHYNPPGNIKIQEIKALLVTKSGDLFIGSLHGLYIFRKGKFIVVENTVSVTALAQDSNRAIWAGTTFGLYRYNPGRNRLDSISIGQKRFEVTSIACDAQSNALFLGTWGNGLVKYDIATGTYKKYLAGAGDGQLTSNNTYRVVIDKSQNVWVGCWGGGLNRLDMKSQTFETVSIKPYNVYNRDYDIVLSIMQDNAGILWVGTDGGGVCKLDPYRKKFKTISNAGLDQPILSNTHITAVYEDRDQSLWLGTKGGGLSVSTDGKNFINKDVGIKNIRVNTFFEKDNDLWVGTGDGLVILKNYKHSQRTVLISGKSRDTSSLSGPKVTCIVKDKSGIIWVGTQEHGLNRVLSYKRDTPVFKRYPEHVGSEGALQNDRVSCMLVDRSNRLWVGTYDGLHLYNREQDNFSLVPYKPGSENSLSNNSILSIAEDSYGHVWVGTQQGLNELSFGDGGKLQIQSFLQCPGFPNDYIHSVLIDHENNVWMSTNRGITKYDVRIKTFRNFDTRDGVSSNTFSENASYVRDDGQMFFGSIDGLTYFYPDSIYLNQYKPPVYFTKLQVNNKDVGVGTVVFNKDLLPQPLFLQSEINLSYKQNIISLSFAALDYHASDKNRYQYMLEGFDDHWVDAGYRRNVTYTNLPSGTYTFKIKASNSDQVWSNDVADLKIFISPPPWRTWWAYLIYFLIISGLLWFSRYIKLRRIYLQNRLEIANIKYEKEREIAEIKSRFFTNISHEFRTPLTLMIGPLEDLVADTRLNQSVKNTIRKIQNQSKRLLSLINQLLDFHKAESNAMQLNTAYHDIVTVAKTIVESFEEEADRKNISFSFQSDPKELYLLMDKEKVESVVYNLLSNAFKFTPPGGQIQFRVRYAQDPQPVCELIVADTGKGIEARDKPKIFDRFYQVAQAEPGRYTGTGIGLAFVKDLVELHKGTIVLQDNQPQGSVFTIKLPARPIDLLDEQFIEADQEDEAEPFESTERQGAEPPIFLVIEDNDELNQYLCKVLSKSGETVSARDGREGLEKAFQIIPDLIVSDVMMPEVDGYELCKKIKEDNRTSHIPVILLTAKSDDLSQIEGIKLGADIYLGKPFKPELLTSHVKNLIKSRKRLKELFAQRLNLTPSEVEVASFSEEFIKNAIHFVEENIEKEEFSIDDLANKLNMSRSTFYRKLKALTGMSGNDFIRTIKLQRSAQLLKSGEYTVSMAAFSAGFNDLKHFRKSFQKQFGITPSEYMKKKEANPN
jgi:signal transduction histidine kinase/ligand-binding sensor domain-containing protein/DNA-binding response OmpR family regulator